MIRRSQTLRPHRTSLVPRPSVSSPNQPSKDLPSPNRPVNGSSPKKPVKGTLSDSTLVEKAKEEAAAREAQLRAKVLELEEENSKLKEQTNDLRRLLAERPTVLRVQELEKEYSTLEGILDGTQRENLKCMDEIRERKERERKLEEGLRILVGPSWAEMLDMAPTYPKSSRTSLLLDFPGTSLLRSPLADAPESLADTSLGSLPEVLAETSLNVIPLPVSEPLAEAHRTPDSEDPPQVVDDVFPSQVGVTLPEMAVSQIEINRISVLEMERRLRACETVLKRLLRHTDHPGDLSVIREELEVEGLTGFAGA